MGGLSLFCSWLFFNAGSAKTVQYTDRIDVSKATQCTLISATSACLICVVILPFLSSSHNPTAKWQIGPVVNSLMAGCVSITASCNNVGLFTAIVIGAIGSVIYLVARKIFQHFEIDDPIEASIIHGVNGFWGLIAVGIFDNKTGLLYSSSSKQLQVQMLGAVAIMTWSGLLTYVFVTTAKKIQRFRVGEIVEVIGSDRMYNDEFDLRRKSDKEKTGVTMDKSVISKIERRQRQMKS
jgi:ammonium transporter, Amt family